MRKILPAVFICLIFSCSKEVFKNNSIVGRWKLSEYYFDIGNGSHEWQKPDGLYTIEFKANGDYVTIGNAGTVTGKYFIIDSSNLKFVETPPSPAHLTYRYSLNSNNSELILYPPCIEGCASKYVAVKK